MTDEDKHTQNLFDEDCVKPLFGQTDHSMPTGKPLFSGEASVPDAVPDAKPLFGQTPQNTEEESSLEDFQAFDAVQEEPRKSEEPSPCDPPAAEPSAPAPENHVVPSDPPAAEPSAPAPENNAACDPPAPESGASLFVQREQPGSSIPEKGGESVRPGKLRGIVRPPAHTISLPGDLESMSLGAIMALARERAGLSLEEVRNGTKLHDRFLQAIERDRFDSLPSGVFPGAYIRALCSLYHLDSTASEIAQRKAAAYCTKAPVPDEVYNHLPEHAHINVEEQEKFRKWFIAAVSVVCVLFVVILAAVAWSLFKKDQPDPVQSVSPVTMESLERLSGPRMPTMRKLKVPGDGK